MSEIGEALARRYRLRPTEDGSGWIGLVEGVPILVEPHEGFLRIRFPCHGKALPGTGVRPFAATSALGVPLDWIQKADCGIVLDQERLGTLGDERLLDLPGRMASDLRPAGFTPCRSCQSTATTFAIVDDEGRCLCAPCWDRVRAGSERGWVRSDKPIPWATTVTLLLALTVVGATAWESIQVRKAPGGALILFPMAWAAVVAATLSKVTRTAPTPLLTLLVTGSSLLGTLAGNAWAFAVVSRRPILSGAGLYFTDRLPSHLGDEAIYVVGCIIGAFMMMKGLRTSQMVKLL